MDMKRKAVEIEGKFRVGNLDTVRERLSRLAVERVSVTGERNTVHDIFGLFQRRGWMLRLRSNGNGNFFLTLKGSNSGDAVAKRREVERRIPRIIFSLLRLLLPTVSEYRKTRESYVPPDDARCTICLDIVRGKGKFVEIEASSENAVLLWKKRLGIEGEAIRTPYFKMEDER